MRGQGGDLFAKQQSEDSRFWYNLGQRECAVHPTEHSGEACCGNLAEADASTPPAAAPVTGGEQFLSDQKPQPNTEDDKGGRTHSFLTLALSKFWTALWR